MILFVYTFKIRNLKNSKNKKEHEKCTQYSKIKKNDFNLTSTFDY
jgi:hypothetical protein